MSKKIILLTGGGQSSLFMYNGIKDEFAVSSIVIEGKGDRKKFLKRRIKRLGYLKVVGQILFQLSIPKLLKLTAQKRIAEIKAIYGLDDTPFPPSIAKKVPSVNSDECLEYLKREKPDLIIVNGTRIISKRILNSIDAVFINTHVGITPKYRGVHGGYWAIANNDRDNCGVTVHLVDNGIDTGSVLFQKNIVPQAEDNFSTYTYLQIGEGIELMKKAISDFMFDRMEKKASGTQQSKLWYHPTLWFYLYKRLASGVK